MALGCSGLFAYDSTFLPRPGFGIFLRLCAESRLGNPAKKIIKQSLAVQVNRDQG